MVKQLQLLIHFTEVWRKHTANIEECSARTMGIPQLPRQVDIAGKTPSFPKKFSFALAVLYMAAGHISLDLRKYLGSSSWRSHPWRWKRGFSAHVNCASHHSSRFLELRQPSKGQLRPHTAKAETQILRFQTDMDFGGTCCKVKEKNPFWEERRWAKAKFSRSAQFLLSCL